MIMVFISHDWLVEGLCTDIAIVRNYRQAEAGNKGHRYDPERRGVRESRAVPAPDANAELASSMQVSFCHNVMQCS